MYHKKKKRRSPKQQNDIWFSHQSIIGTLEAKNTPKSEEYRSELVPLISKNAELIGKFSRIRKETIAHTRINQILLTDVVIKYKNKIIKTEHIWTTVERGYMDRNKLKQQQFISCNGYFYEYISHGKRNIGFRLISAKLAD